MSCRLQEGRLDVTEYTRASNEKSAAATDAGPAPALAKTSACCDANEQASCCQPSAKAACCGNSKGEDCGCKHKERNVLPSGNVELRPERLPVAVIGAGPVGLAAAAHLIAKGETPLVLEAGDSVGASVLRWGHVRIFSPWRHNIDTAAASLLEAAGWTRPQADAHPTGRDLVERYLAPLAALPAIQPHLRLRTRVLAVSRTALDRTKTSGRAAAPFVLRIETDGVVADVKARAVIDASGTFRLPNPLGASGLPALGEDSLADRIFYGIPDVLGAARSRYAGRKVLVVGSGHSALNVLLDLAALAEVEPATRIVWAVRRPAIEGIFGGGEKDQLEERGRLGSGVRDLSQRGVLQIVPGFAITQLEGTASGIVVSSELRRLEPVDEVVATTGFRPDVSMLRELRLALDPIVESPVALAPLIDPNVHSCGSVPPHGARELQQPEQDFYIVGMKSYGRAPTFLMLTGYEQVRSVVCALTGDLEGARAIQLVLPETGVCSLDAIAAQASSCCGPPPRASGGSPALA
jgi:thioredoxin reductase